MKRSYKSKNNKKAFTLIELLIVIAIIGILFIVLVSKVDFATDKAKATGVQTDFRSFQVALDQVAKENAGFNMFGWDTGDVNGDHIRNSYDKGDTNQNGKEDAGETFIGRKTYGEEWTTIYTMLNPKVGMENDDSAFVALETAINANLDPKLHITITPDVDGGVLTGNATITMANQARDPWKNEYHGVFITNAARDNGADRGAIIIYSNGANGKWGSAHDITDGVVSVTVPNNNKLGQDDYSIVSCYTYVNGYGEVLNMTTGFSSNQGFLNGGASAGIDVGGNAGGNNPAMPHNPYELYVDVKYVGYGGLIQFMLRSDGTAWYSMPDGEIVLPPEEFKVENGIIYLYDAYEGEFFAAGTVEEDGKSFTIDGITLTLETERQPSNLKYDSLYCDEDGEAIMFNSDGTAFVSGVVFPVGFFIIDSETITLKIPDTGEVIAVLTYVAEGDSLIMYDVQDPTTPLILSLTDKPAPLPVLYNIKYADDGGYSWAQFTIDGGLMVYSFSHYNYYAPDQLLHIGKHIYVKEIDSLGNETYKSGWIAREDYFGDGDMISITPKTDRELHKAIDKVIYSPDFKTCYSYGNAYDYRLADVTIADGTTTIASSFFASYRAIKTLTIPASVTTIEGANFSALIDLTDIYFQGTAQQWAAFGITLPAGVNVHFN